MSRLHRVVLPCLGLFLVLQACGEGTEVANPLYPGQTDFTNSEPASGYDNGDLASPKAGGMESSDAPAEHPLQFRPPRDHRRCDRQAKEDRGGQQAHGRCGGSPFRARAEQVSGHVDIPSCERPNLDRRAVDDQPIFMACPSSGAYRLHGGRNGMRTLTRLAGCLVMIF